MGQTVKTQPNMAIQPMKAQAQSAQYGVIPGTMAMPGVGAAPVGMRPPVAPIPQMPASGVPQGPQGYPAAGMPPSGVPQGPVPQRSVRPIGVSAYNPAAPGGVQPSRFAAALRGQRSV
jgi:hypothetical protein